MATNPASGSGLTTGEVRFASMVKGMIEYLGDIDFFTSEGYIKEGLNKVKQLAVDLSFMLPAGRKLDYIHEKLVHAAAWFTSQWKGANGDRSGYKIAPEVITHLQSVMAVVDIPNTLFQAQGPSAATTAGQAVQAAGGAAASAAVAAAGTPTSAVPSEAPATDVHATNVGTEAEREAARAAADKEKKKDSWIYKQTYGVPNWGLLLSGGLLSIGLASGVGAGILKKKRGSKPQVSSLSAAAALANPRRRKSRRKSRR